MKNRNSRLKKKSFKFPTFAVVSFFVLAFYSLSLILPFGWALLTSLKSNFDYLIDPLGFPKNIVDNYTVMFDYFFVPVRKGIEIKQVGIFPMVLNSLWYAVGCAFVSMIVSFLAGYIVSRFNFRFLKIVYSVIIISMIIPTVGTLPSEIRIASLLGLYDTPYGMLFMKAYVTGIYFLVFYAACKVIPKDYSEAAYIDGASNFSVMIRIIMPMVSGTLSAVFLLNFISFWNDYQTPLIYMPSYPTFAYGLYYYINGSYELSTSTVPMRLAGCMLMAIPLFILFIIFQKRIMVNVSGGLK